MSLILAFHGVAEKLDEFDNAVGNRIQMNTFEQTLERFKVGYQFVSLEQFISDSSKNSNLISLTFDDGNYSVYKNVYPLLNKRGIPFSVFINSLSILRAEPHWFELLEAGFRKSQNYFSLSERLSEFQKTKFLLKKREVRMNDLEIIFNRLGVSYESVKDFCMDKDRQLTLEELRELSSDGVLIGSHGLTHQILSRLTEEQQGTQIKESKNQIEAITGNNCNLFAYPNGWIGDYTVQTIRLLQESGYRAALTANTEISRAKIESVFSLYELPRFLVGQKNIQVFNKI